MSCRIYTATNASCIVGGEPPAGEEAAIRQDFEAGVSLVVDTTGDETIVRGAIPAHRDAPEALVGVVPAPRGEEPLQYYHDAVRDVFDERSGWRVRTDVVNGRLFEALGEAAGPGPDDELRSSIRSQRREGERVEVGVPDAKNAVGLLGEVLDGDGRGVYVISTQEPPDHLDPDVFVHLAERYSRPELIDLETDLSAPERIGRRIDELVDELPPPTVASRLESETRQRNVSLGFEAESSGSSLPKRAIAGGLIGAAVAVVLAGGTVAAAGDGVTLGLEWLPVVGGSALPAWTPLLAGLLAVVAAVSIGAVRSALAEATSIDSVLGSQSTLEPAHRERLETIAAILEQHSLEMDSDPYRTARSALEARPIRPVKQGGASKITGVLALLLPAVVLIAVAWVLVGMLPNTTVAMGLLVVGAVAVLGRAAVALRAVEASIGGGRSGTSSDQGPRRDREDTADTTDESDDGQSDLGVRAVDDTNQSETSADSASSGGQVVGSSDEVRGDEAEHTTEEAPAPVIGSAEGSDESPSETTGTADPIIGGSDTDDGSDSTGGSVTSGTDTFDDDQDVEAGDGDDQGSGGEDEAESDGEEDGTGADIGEAGEDDTFQAVTADDGSDTDGPDSNESDETEATNWGTDGPAAQESDTATDGMDTGPSAESTPETRDKQEPDEQGTGASDDEDQPSTVDRILNEESSPSSDPSSSGIGVDSGSGGDSSSEGPTTRGAFETFFDEFSVTTAPVVTEDRVFVAGHAGLDELSVPIDPDWLPEQHRDTVRRGRIRAHLTRLTPDGTHDGTVPFTNRLAEPIVGGNGAVYVADASSTVGALENAGAPAIRTFRNEPDHFSGDHLLYVSDQRRSRFLGPDLKAQYERSGVLTVPPMVTENLVTLCLEDGQTHQMGRRNDYSDQFPSPGGTLVGSAVVDGTPYVASESGNVYPGWNGTWKDPMRIHSRVNFRWFDANDSTLVLAGRSVVYTLDPTTRGVNSLERTISTSPTVTDDGIYFASDGELVWADPGLNRTAAVDLPWSIDGMTAGADRLYVTADGGVWTIPFSAVR